MVLLQVDAEPCNHSRGRKTLVCRYRTLHELNLKSFCQNHSRRVRWTSRRGTHSAASLHWSATILWLLLKTQLRCEAACTAEPDQLPSSKKSSRNDHLACFGLLLCVDCMMCCALPGFFKRRWPLAEEQVRCLEKLEYYKTTINACCESKAMHGSGH